MSERKTDYLVLVNKEHRVPDDFEDTIELISVVNAEGKRLGIEKKTCQAFLRLREDLLKNDGIQAELLGVYRTVEEQEEIFERYTREHGLEFAKTYAAMPGHSEHHTGLAIDVSFMLNGIVCRGVDKMLSIDYLFKIIQAKLPKYGFILRYPAGKEEITKIGYEPWHFRYIDAPEIATEITEQGICFEEYWQKLDNKQL